MKKILSYSLMLLSVIAMLSTCSSPEDIFPPTTSEDTIITDEERMMVFEACNKKSVELNNLESLEDRVSFLGWLATQQAFYSVGFAGEDLYAVFQDDRVVMFVNTPLGEPIGGRVSTGHTTKPAVNENPRGRTADLPNTKKVSLFSGMGERFGEHYGEVLKILFDDADAGYQVELKRATIENLKRVSGDAVFYINTHGGAGHITKRRDSPTIMALFTDDSVNVVRDYLYRDDLTTGRLCYMHAKYDTDSAEFHYAITSSFVREYMSFGENCLIYLDACHGHDESIIGNTAFRERMMDRAINKKATYVGWTAVTDNVTTQYTTQFIFDRLLAANTGPSLPGLPKEDPRQRPFDLAPVFNDMRNRRLGVSPHGGELVYTTSQDDEILLRPTIETMELDEFTNTLIIKGLFGKDQGTVTINNVAMVIRSWTHYGIACILPETGDGSAGPVVVKSAEGIKSNAVPLTEWIIKLHYSSDDNGIKFAGVCDLRLRADVHLRRSKIHETPTKPTYPDISPNSGYIFNVKGSSAVYTVTGRKYDACNIGPCNYQFTESPTPKVGTIAYTLPNQTSAPLFAMYNWGPEMKFVKISHLNINVTAIPLIFEERVQCPDLPEYVAPIEMPYDAFFGFPTHEIEGSITLEIAENFNMRPGSWTKTINRPWGGCSATGSFKQTVSWEVIVPKHAPTDKTDARVGQYATED